MKIHRTRAITFALLLGSLLATGASALAVPFTGTFNITGSVIVSLSTIDWEPAGGTTGNFTTASPSTGDFASPNIFCGNPPYCSGVVKDLTGSPAVLDGVVSVADFLTFALTPQPNLKFDLDGVISPTAPACTSGYSAINSPCSLGSFTLTNNPGVAPGSISGVTVALGLQGFFDDGPGGKDVTGGRGLYTTQLDGSTISSVYNTIVTTGGSINASYSANYSTLAQGQIPEPATFLLLGLGLGAVGMIRRRK